MRLRWYLPASSRRVPGPTLVWAHGGAVLAAKSASLKHMLLPGLLRLEGVRLTTGWRRFLDCIGHSRTVPDNGSGFLVLWKTF